MRHLSRLYASSFWRIGTGVTVLINSIVLGAIAEAPEGTVLIERLDYLDSVLLTILFTDVVLCIAVKRRAVLHNGWDMFDIAVTLGSIVPNIDMLSAFLILR